MKIPSAALFLSRVAALRSICIRTYLLCQAPERHRAAGAFPLMAVHPTPPAGWCATIARQYASLPSGLERMTAESGASHVVSETPANRRLRLNRATGAAGL